MSQSKFVGLLEFEITRVDCTAFGVYSVKYNSILQWKKSKIIFLVRMEDSRLNLKVK